MNEKISWDFRFAEEAVSWLNQNSGLWGGLSEADHRECYDRLESDGFACVRTPLGNVFMAKMKGGAEADAEQALYHDIWEEILRGDHDTSDGHAPDSVGQDIDGNWFVSYPPIVDGGIRWENKVRSI